MVICNQAQSNRLFSKAEQLCSGRVSNIGVSCPYDAVVINVKATHELHGGFNFLLQIQRRRNSFQSDGSYDGSFAAVSATSGGSGQADGGQ